MYGRLFALSHPAGFAAATGQAQPVAGEDAISEFEHLMDAGEATDRHQPPESHCTVQLAEDFDSLDPGSVRESAMDFAHQVTLDLSQIGGVEGGIRDVRELDPLPTVQTTQHSDLAAAERALAVIEDFEFPAGNRPVVVDLRC